MKDIDGLVIMAWVACVTLGLWFWFEGARAVLTLGRAIWSY